MAKKRPTTTNITLLKLKGTPFKNAKDLKFMEEKILKQEWENVERARVRRELLHRDENRVILAPLHKGFKAKFLAHASAGHDNLVKVYLTSEDELQVDIGHELKVNEVNESIASLVRTLIQGLMNGYLATLGLNADPKAGTDSPRQTVVSR